jgi:hypothetical protein
MRTIFYTFLVIACAACNNRNETANAEALPDSTKIHPNNDSTATGYIYNFVDTALENKVTAAILKLPFVQKSNRYIDSFSNHTQRLSFMLDKEDSKDNMVSVQAGYNGEQRFETYYRFYVNPVTLEIKVYDPVTDKKLTVQEYSRMTQ